MCKKDHKFQSVREFPLPFWHTERWCIVFNQQNRKFDGRASRFSLFHSIVSRFNEWDASVNVREEEINREFQLNRSHLRKHRETRHWPTYLTNFFGHRRIMFSRASVQTAVNRARRVEISPGASLFANCLLPIGIAIRTNQSHRPGSCGSDFRCAIFHGIRITSNNIPIFRKYDCMICSRIFALSAGVSLERVKKVIVCFARRVLHRVFPDPENVRFFNRDYSATSSFRIFAFNVNTPCRIHERITSSSGNKWVYRPIILYL